VAASGQEELMVGAVGVFFSMALTPLALASLKFFNTGIMLSFRNKFVADADGIGTGG
jgi:hypothetical protein